jgi:hypothetical protein
MTEPCHKARGDKEFGPSIWFSFGSIIQDMFALV